MFPRFKSDLQSDGPIAFMFATGSIIGQRMVLRLEEKRNPQHTERTNMSGWVGRISLSDDSVTYDDPQTTFDPVQIS